MNPLAILRPFFFALLFVTAGCGEKDNAQAPAPKAHTVEVRYSAANVSGLGARLSGGSVTPEGTNPQNLYSATVSSNVSNQVLAAGQVTSDREFNCTLFFDNVKAQGATAPAGAYLTADILVDGVVKKTVRLDSTIPANGHDAQASVTVMTYQW